MAWEQYWGGQWLAGEKGERSAGHLPPQLHGPVKLNRGTSNVDWYHWCGIFIPLCGQIIIRKNRTKNRETLRTTIVTLCNFCSPHNA